MRIFSEQAELLWSGPGNSLVGAELRSAKLEGAQMLGLDLRFADLTNAKITAANFTNSRLDEAVLRLVKAGGARFDNCSLQKAIFYGAALVGASFRGADLTKADLRGCDLRAADLRGALMKGTLMDKKDPLTDLDFSQPPDTEISDLTPYSGFEDDLPEDPVERFLAGFPRRQRKDVLAFCRAHGVQIPGERRTR